MAAALLARLSSWRLAAVPDLALVVDADAGMPARAPSPRTERRPEPLDGGARKPKPHTTAAKGSGRRRRPPPWLRGARRCHFFSGRSRRPLEQRKERRKGNEIRVSSRDGGVQVMRWLVPDAFAPDRRISIRRRTAHDASAAVKWAAAKKGTRGSGWAGFFLAQFGSFIMPRKRKKNWGWNK